MKNILAGVVFAGLVASPLFAQSRSTEGPSHSDAYLEQKKQSRTGFRDLDGSARMSHRRKSIPASNPDPIKQGLCSTASGFCPDYHGGNGG